MQWNKASNHLLMASGSPDSSCTVDIMQWSVISNPNTNTTTSTTQSQDNDTIEMSIESTNTTTNTTTSNTTTDYNLIMVDRLVAHSSNCYCLKLDSSFTHMAVGSGDFLISLWDLQDLCCLTTISSFS